MNADELDDLLDGLPDAEQWMPVVTDNDIGPPPTKPSLWAQPIFNLDPMPKDSESARASSVAVVESLASTPGRVPTIAESEWTQALEAGSAFRSKHESEKRGSARFVDLANTGMRVRYHRWGDSSEGVNVMLLHDLSESGASYCGLGESLAGRGYGVFAPDLRGHGDSSWSSEGRYSPDALADDLQCLIVELDLYVRPIVLVGFGYGGGQGPGKGARGQGGKGKERRDSYVITFFWLFSDTYVPLKYFIKEKEILSFCAPLRLRLGGGVAITLAGRKPALVGAVCLVDSAPSVPVDSWRFHPLQAAVFENHKRAVESLCAHTSWGHR